MKHVYRTTAASAALLVTALALAACGDSDSGSMPGMNHSSSGTPMTPPADSAFNDADVTFATQMIPHHQQAVQMASMAGYQATTPEVKKLATAIQAAQDPEIKLMSGWLTAWGKPVPTPSHDGHGMSEPMPGMMSEEQMSELSKADGSMFDRMWIQLMIKHHQGAVAMAKTEQSTGKAPAAIALAKTIETAQAAEIATMQRLQGRLPVG